MFYSTGSFFVHKHHHLHYTSVNVMHAPKSASFHLHHYHHHHHYYYFFIPIFTHLRSHWLLRWTAHQKKFHPHLGKSSGSGIIATAEVAMMVYVFKVATPLIAILASKQQQQQIPFALQRVLINFSSSLRFTCTHISQHKYEVFESPSPFHSKFFFLSRKALHSISFNL